MSVPSWEDKIINKIDIMRLCKNEINQIFRLVKSKDFDRNLTKQDELALLARGTYLKLKTIKAKIAFEEDNIDDMMRIISGLAKSYGSMYDKKEGRTTTVGSAENPMTINVSFIESEDKDGDRS